MKKSLLVVSFLISTFIYTVHVSGQGTPANFAGSAAGTTISLSWTIGTVGGGDDGYVIRAKQNPTGTFPTFATGTEDLNLTDVNLSGIHQIGSTATLSYNGFTAAAGKRYDFEIAAYDNNPSLSFGTAAAVTVYTLATAPGAYSGTPLAATGTSSQINLSFVKASKSSGTNAHGFLVLRHQGSNPTLPGSITNGNPPAVGSDLIAIITDSTATTYSDVVTPGVSFTYALVPYRVGFNGSTPINQTYNYGSLTTFATAARPLELTIIDRNSTGANGVATDGLIGGSPAKAIIGFALISNATDDVTNIKIHFDADPDLFYNSYSLVESTDDVLYEGTDGTIGLTSSNVTDLGGGVWEIDLDPTADLTINTSERRFFLVANVDNNVTTATDAILATLANTEVDVVGSSTILGSATGINYDMVELALTLANRNTPATHGVAVDGLGGGLNDQAIIGFALTSNGSEDVSSIKINFDADPDLFYTGYTLIESTNNNLYEPGTDGAVSLTSNNVTNLGGGVWEIDLVPMTNLTITASQRRFFLVVDVKNTVVTAPDVIQATLATAGVSVVGNVGSKTGSATGINYDMIGLQLTISDRNNTGTHGVATDGLVGNSPGKAILGFALVSTGTEDVSHILINFDADPDSFFNTYSLVESTDDILFEGTDGAVPLSSSMVTDLGGGVWQIDLDPTADLTITTSERRFFLVANVDNNVTTAADVIQATLVTGGVTVVGGAGTKTGSATGINYDMVELQLTIADRNNPGTHGVAVDGLVGNTPGNAILGFALTSNGTELVSNIKINFDADPDLFYNTYSLVESTDDILFEGTDSAVPLTSSNVTNLGGGVWEINIDPTVDLTINTSERRFFLVANVDNGVTTGADAVQATLSTAGIMVVGTIGTKTGSATGIDYDFVGLVLTISDRNNTGTNGVATEPLEAGTTVKAIIGFALTSNGNEDVSSIKINFDADPDAFYNTYTLRESTDDVLFEVSDPTVPLTSSNVTNLGGGVWEINLDPTADLTITSTERRFFLVASVDNTLNASTNSIQGTLAAAGVTVVGGAGTKTGSATGIDYDFTPSVTSTFALNGGTNVTTDYISHLDDGNITNDTDSENLATFRITDSDADGHPTSLDALSITLTNPGYLARVSLFVGSSASTTEATTGTGAIEQAVPPSGNVSFTDIQNISAGDNATQDITIRVSFKNSLVIEGTPIQVTVTALTVKTTNSSGFAAGEPGGTDTSGATANKINVLTDRLSFASITPVNPTPNELFTAVVHQVDVNGSLDTDASSPDKITIAETGGPGVLTGGSEISPVAGVYTFNSLSINLAGAHTLHADDLGTTSDDGAAGQTLAEGLTVVTIKSLGVIIDKAIQSSCHVGTGSYYVQLDTIMLTERDPADFSNGSNQTILIVLPNGWEFNTANNSPSFGFTGGQDITSSSFQYYVGKSIAKFKYSVSGITGDDEVLITGLTVKNVDATLLDKIVASTAGIVGVDDTTTLGKLSYASNSLLNFTVQSLPTNTAVSPTKSFYGINDPTVILNASVNGIAQTDLSTVNFSGNGVSLKLMDPPISADRYLFNPQAVVLEDSIPITLTVTNPAFGCIDTKIRNFFVGAPAIQGLTETSCTNDVAVYPISIDPSKLPPSYYTVKDFAYLDQNLLNASLALTNNPNPALSDVVFYSGNVATGLQASPTKFITNITFNPYNTGFVYAYQTGIYTYAPVTDPGPVYNNFYTATSFVKLTIPNHGYAVNEKVTFDYWNIFYAAYYPGYPDVYGGADYTVVGVIDANNIIINAAEVWYQNQYGTPWNPYSDYGILYFTMYGTAPYNIPVNQYQTLDMYFDIKIPNHTFTDGDEVTLSNFYGFNYYFNDYTFPVDSISPDYIRINLANHAYFYGTTSMRGNWAGQTYGIKANPYQPLPGRIYDPNLGFPHLGAARSATTNAEFTPSGFNNSWPYNKIEIVDRVYYNGYGYPPSVYVPNFSYHSAVVDLVPPPVVDFTGLAAAYCNTPPGSPITLQGTNSTGTLAVDGTFSGLGISDGGGGITTANFDPAAGNITPDVPFNVTFSFVNGCTGSMTKQVIVYSLPTANAGGDQVICNGQTIAIGGSGGTPTGSGTNLPLTYLWDNETTLGDGVTSQFTPNPGAHPVSNTTYSVIVTNAKGCVDTDVMQVSVNQPATVNAGPITLDVCSAIPIDLAAKLPGANYSGTATSATWGLAAGSNLGNFEDGSSASEYDFDLAETFTPSPSDITNKKVTIYLRSNDPDAGGPCLIAVDTVHINIQPTPTAPVIAELSGTEKRMDSFQPANKTANSEYYCVTPGSVTPVTLQVSTSGSDFSVKWYNDAGATQELSTLNPWTTSVTNARDTFKIYYAAQLSALGCISALVPDTIWVQPAPKPDFDVFGLCEGDTTFFRSKNISGTLSSVPYNNVPGTIDTYVWQFKDNTGSYGPATGTTAVTGSTTTFGTYDSIYHIFAQSGIYDVSLTLTTDDGCVNSITSQLSTFGQNNIDVPGAALRIGKVPVANFGYTNICEGDLTQFDYKNLENPADGDMKSWDWSSQTSVFASSIDNPSYTYADFGTDSVTLVLTSKLNCVDAITKPVFILPYITDFTNPYDESFDTPLHGWVHEGLAVDFRTSTIPDSWNLVDLSADPGSVITSTGARDQWALMTRAINNDSDPLNDTTYLHNERSVLYGPCIDVTALERPALSFSYWDNTQNRSDGVYVETSINGGNTWQPLGNANTGLRWYNESSISGLTSQQNVVNNSNGGTVGQPLNQFGFTGDNNGWQVGKYSLQSLAAESKVRIRFVFGSNGDNPPNEKLNGFALDYVRLDSRNRVLLAENFTTNNDVSTIVAANNLGFKKILEALTDEEIVKIQYHTTFLSSDAINALNPADPNSRASFYGITTSSNLIPRGFIDGYTQKTEDGPGRFGTPWVKNYISTRSLEDAPFTINVSTLPTDPGAVSVHVDLNVETNMLPGTKPVMRVALVEKTIINGTDTLKYVLRKMLPSAAGYPLFDVTNPVPLTAGQAITVPDFTWRIDNESINQDSLVVVVFIQDQETDIEGKRPVYQSAIDVNPNIINGSVTSVEDPDYGNKISFYPNPANHEVNVVLPAAVNKTTPVTMVDTYGKVIYQNAFSPGQRTKTINTTELTSGMYIIQIANPGGGITRKKIMVVH